MAAVRARSWIRGKRVFDTALVVAAAPLWIPLLLGVLLLTWADSGRPLFFVQTRMGLGQRPFRLVKVRTMQAGVAAPKGEPFTGWTYVGDPRVTSLGRVLRRFRLDEIPQLLNVLAGDMSLVGPRPEPWDIAVSLGREIEGYHRRHRVRPGLTGLCQTSRSYRDFGTIEKAAQKVKLDFAYVEHLGPAVDFKILIKTVFVLFRGEGVA